MAEPTGTARQEAERLVATVLAMASQAGLGGPPKDRDPGTPGLGDMISGLMDQFLGGAPGSPRSGSQEATDAAGTGSRDAARDSADAEEAGSRDADRDSAPIREAGSRDAVADAGVDAEGGAPAGGAGPRPEGAHDDQEGWDWREAYQQTLDGLGAAARKGAGQAAGQQLWEGVARLGGWSTGSPECCVCPICRAIAGLRNPSPEQAERLATGAGDFANGVASLLRAFSAMSGTTGTSTRRRPPARPTTTPDQAWSTATRRAEPAGTTPPGYEVREGDDPWTAATRASRPGPTPAARAARSRPNATEARDTESRPVPGSGETPAGRATAPTDTTTRSAAEQAAAQTDATGADATGLDATDLDATGADATGLDATGADAAGEPPAPISPPGGDPWAAATRAPRRPVRPRTGFAGTPRPAGESAHAEPGADDVPMSAPARDAGPARSARAARQAAEQSDAAGPGSGAAGGSAARARAQGDPWAAATAGQGPGADKGAGASRPVTGATDVRTAATGVNGDTAGDTGVADTPSVDHDVPGTAPAASAAEGRGAGPGDDARSGDAV